MLLSEENYNVVANTKYEKRGVIHGSSQYAAAGNIQGTAMAAAGARLTPGSAVTVSSKPYQQIKSRGRSRSVSPII